ncbi:MAG: hypothetical protein ACOX9R_05630 [Armatimonadota bacterium]|jgi:hypothetical protein
MGSLQHGTLNRALALLLSALALSAASYAPAAPDALLLSACEDLADFSTARAPDEPSFDFSAWETSVFAGARVKGSSLRWHMRPSSPSQTSARLALTRPLPGATVSVSVWLKNPNAHQLTLQLEIIDADGARYLSPPEALILEPDWREMVFDLREMTGPEDDPNPGIDRPIIRAALLLEGLTHDRPHTVYLDEITATVADLPPIAIANVRCQTSLGPGEPLPVRVELSPASMVDDARLVAELASPGGGPLAQALMRMEDAPGEPATASGTLRVPEWVRPGRYEVRLTSRIVELSGPGARPVGVVVAGASTPRAEAAVDAGVSPPAITLGGAAHRPLVEELRGSLPGSLSEGARIVAVPVTLDDHPFAWAPTAADEAGELSFAGLDRRVAAVLTARPAATLVLQVFLDATREWKAEHPPHLQRFGGETLAPEGIIAIDRRHPDIISAAWRSDAESRLRALVRHVDASAWGHRVIGYELQAGDLGAWRPWGASLGVGDETTPVRQEAFMGWLHARYPAVTDLRDHWLGRRRGFGQPRAGFESVQMPTPMQDAPEPSLYDPASDQPMIDLLHFRAETSVDALLAMAAAVREEAGSGVLVGACYGHLLSQARVNDWSWPHTALSRLLASGSLDFLTGPQMRIDDASQPSSPGESIRRGGALYLERVHGSATVPADCGAIVAAGETGALTRLPTPRAPAVEANVIEVIDDLSARYLSGDAALPRELLTRPISGSIAHETFLLRDLLGPNPPRAEVYVFRNVFTITPDEGRLLGRNTARDGSLLVWVYAPGAIDRHLITGRTMQYLTGIKLSPLHQRGSSTVRPENRQFGSFGFPHPVSPRFISADERAEWLGTINDGGTNRCGFALRKFDHCTSVFAAAPPPEEMLRHLAGRSGITVATRQGD